MNDARDELEEAIDAVIVATVAAETASMRRELDALYVWMKVEVQKLQAREAFMLERLRLLQAMEVAQAGVDNIAETRTLN
jgi:hypothetical protein